ncbi:CoA transferase [Nocardia sp.]|uniref:CoA transferase n=1 Tax=Nocardia sp. TaxID=1821 RepID=UPI0026385A4E|nr:CoA transferase [Nocardia sp.]
MPDRSKDRQDATALSGLRVVEFGHYLAGPLAGVFLADQGADVIVVQPPGGSGTDPATSAILQRGKSVRVIDLRDVDAAARVRVLVEAADVVIENFRPGVMDRLGFGYAQVVATNPGVIYLSLPGFSRHDERSSMPGWEGAISAACGFYSDLSLPAFRRLPAQEWEQRLTESGVPAAMQRTTAEWVEHALALGNGIVRRAGDHVEPGPQVDVTAAGLTDPETATGTWPHARTFDPIATGARPATGWLDGITVLDLSNVIAGPSCARTLAELGADVVQIVPTVPKMGPRQTLHFGLEVNPGKRSIAVDLATEGGQGVLRDLIARADVLAHNCLPHQARRLGFDPDSAHRVDRRVITVAMTAHGGPDQAASDLLPGYDPTLQAATGIMTRYGGERTPALHGLASCIDYFTGYSGAFAAILGLVARSRSGYDISARTSLARMATWIQLPFLNGDGTEPSGLDASGTDPADQIYKARDGWLFLSAGDRSTRTPGVGVPADLPARIARYTVAEAVRYALEQDWAAHPIVTGRMMRRAAPAARNPAPAKPEAAPESSEGPSGRVEFVDHPSGLRYWVPVASWVRSDFTPRRSLSPAPFPGQHTAEILAELGRTPQDIAQLHSAAIVADRWATGGLYLPR